MAGRMRQISWRRAAGWILSVALLFMAVFYGGRAWLTDAHGPVRLVVYSFSTQEEVLTQAIFTAV